MLQTVLFIMCAGNEMFFAMLYLLAFGSGPVRKLNHFFVPSKSDLYVLTKSYCNIKSMLMTCKMENLWGFG